MDINEPPAAYYPRGPLPLSPASCLKNDPLCRLLAPSYPPLAARVPMGWRI